MKKFVLLLTLLGIQLFNFSQVMDFKEKNGNASKTLEMKSDDPDNVPRTMLILSAGTLSPNSYLQGLPFLVFLEGQKKLSDRIRAEMIISSPVTKALDATQSTDISVKELNPTFVITNMHLKYYPWSTDVTRPRKTVIGGGMERGYSVRYIADVPRTVRNALALDLGLGYYRYPVELELQQNFNHPKYVKAFNFRCTHLSIGFSHTREQSYKFNTDGNCKDHVWNQTELFFHLIPVIGLKLDYYWANNRVEANWKPLLESEVKNAPIIRGIGYEVGVQWKFLNSRNGNNAMTLALVIGKMPALEYDEIFDEDSYPTSVSFPLGQIRMGYSFGLQR